MADAKFAQQITRLRQRRTAPLILELDLTQGIAEGPPADPVSALLSRRKLRLGDLLDGLPRAARDDRGKALAAKAGGQRVRLATGQDLRAGSADFRAAGKLAHTW